MINSIYNYYVGQYSNKEYNRYDSHNRKELRNVYDRIIKMSKASPFYKIDMTKESQELAINIKEAAQSLCNISSDLTDAASGQMTFKGIATSSNEDCVSATYIGENKAVAEDSGFNIKVKQLATPQVNTGNYIRPKARSLFSGNYSFDIDIATLTYELQFTVNDNDNNSDIQNKIKKLVNNSHIGLTADIIKNKAGESAIQLTSNMTGMGDAPAIFRISDDNTTQLSGAVDVLGLNSTSSYPSNAVFILNNNENVSASNTFTVDKEFEVTLHSVSDNDETVSIGLKKDMDSLVDSLHELADCYNNMLSIAEGSNLPDSRKLYRDFTGIAERYKDILESNGLNVTEDGKIELDDTRLKGISQEGSLLTTLTDLNSFKKALSDKADSIMINPMEYIKKSMISYKNPQNPSTDTYTTSIYTGLMFNGYI